MPQKIILKAIDFKYLAMRKDETMGLPLSHHRQCWPHLIATYGTIKPTNLNTNRDNLTAPWMPKDSLKDLWKCICDCQIFVAASSKAITDATTMCLKLTIFKNIGIFHSTIDNGKTSQLHSIPWQISRRTSRIESLMH